MSYSEEEIQKYLNILQNENDGLNIIYQVKDVHIPPKTPEKVSCENCGNTHFFKDGGFRFCKKCFSSYNTTPSDPKSLYSPIQTPVISLSFLYPPPLSISVTFYLLLGIFA